MQGHNAYLSINRIIRAKDQLPNQYVIVVKKANVKECSDWKACSRALIATYNTQIILWANAYTRLCAIYVYIFFAYSFLFVSCTLSCLVGNAFLFECSQSNRSMANSDSTVCSFMTTLSLSLSLTLSAAKPATPNEVSNAYAVNLANVLWFCLFHCDFLCFICHFLFQRHTYNLCHTKV